MRHKCTHTPHHIEQFCRSGDKEERLWCARGECSSCAVAGAVRFFGCIPCLGHIFSCRFHSCQKSNGLRLNYTTPNHRERVSADNLGRRNPNASAENVTLDARTERMAASVSWPLPRPFALSLASQAHLTVTNPSRTVLECCQARQCGAD